MEEKKEHYVGSHDQDNKTYKCRIHGKMPKMLLKGTIISVTPKKRARPAAEKPAKHGKGGARADSKKDPMVPPPPSGKPLKGVLPPSGSGAQILG